MFYFQCVNNSLFSLVSDNIQGVSGGVQWVLHRLILHFVSLQAVDRHFKLPHASSKPSRSSSSMEDSSHKTLRFALRATLKTAIYRITTTFGDHLK